jgi:peroxiredoxin
MTIAIGDQVPDVKVFTFGAGGPQATTSADVLGTGKVVLFAVPGAFTPTCSDHHLPGFVMRTEELKAKGVDKIVCLSVNDPFVMGLPMNGAGIGLGTRSQRYAAIIDDGVVTWLGIEPGPGLAASSAEEVLAAL